MKPSRCLGISFFAFLLLLPLVGITALSQERGKAEEYVGSDTCQGCHQELYEGFKKSDPHWKSLADPKIPEGKKGCESCHGPGTKHAEAMGKGFILSFQNENAKDRSDACLKCHRSDKKLFQFERSVHKLTAVGCSDCHRIHGTRVAKKLLKEKDPGLCFSCHGDVKSKFYLPNRHPVLQGAMNCSDCHTPHGTRARASLRKWSKFTLGDDDACFKCHPDKRGPWVFEHQAVKVEGCSICHVPHGSPNRFLLTRRDIRTLCIECHGQPHFPGNSCVNCHTQIHGSNFSSRFLQ